MPIKANKIAQHVVKNGRNATVNREFTREVNKELDEKLQGASVDFDLFSDFTVDEMQQAQIRQSPGTRFNPSRISDAPWYGMPELVKNVHDQLYATHEDTQKLASCKDYRNPQAG